jgi:YtkA-like
MGAASPPSYEREIAMKRNLVVIVVGIMFLILMTWIGTTVTEVLPHQLTPQTQTAHTASYQLTLQVDPNPPPITRPTTLTLQVAKSGTQEAVTDARVVFESSMETMDMGTDRLDAQSQGNGLYRAQVQFSMNGYWRVRTLITEGGKKMEVAVFEITVQ